MSDPSDILTLAEAKKALRIDTEDTDDDVLLAQYITAVSGLLDQRIGPTVARAVSGEAHDGGCTSIMLRFRPVISVSSLVEYTGTSPATLTQMSVTSQPGGSYRLDPYEPQAGLYSGKVHRMSSGMPLWFALGYANVVCSYTAGRVASTSTVEPRIKRAAAICLENLWRDREHSVQDYGEYDVPVQSFPTFAMPRAAADLLAEETGQNEPWGIA